MAKTAVSQWSATRASNSDIDGINIAEGCPAGNVNDAIREIMVQVKEQLGGVNFKGADIASATTTDLSTATGNVVDITGTTTITGLGTVDAGQVFILQFDGALTFTHNGTSLKLPGAANITTAAGDVAVMVSEGSGNWRCVSYQQYSEGVVQSGTWTPVLNFGGGNTGITYSIQKGRYVRRGNVCTAFCYIVLTSQGSSTGAATVTGLPFSAATESSFYWSASVAYNNIGSALSALLPSTSSTLSIYNLTSQMDDTDFLNSAELMFTLTYEVA